MNQADLNNIIAALASDDLDATFEWMANKEKDIDLFLDLELCGVDWPNILNKCRLKSIWEAHYLQLATILDLTCHVIRPIDIAAAFGAKKCLTWMWRQPAALDRHKRTILHAILLGCGMGCISEDKCLEIISLIVQWCTSETQTRLIFLAENRQGFRPLELAAQIGTYRAFLAILEIKSIYLIKTELSGALRFATFDFTEYSPFTSFPRSNRYWMSPLRIIASSPDNFLFKIESSKILNHAFIQKLISSAFRRNCLHILIKTILTFVLCLFWPGIWISRIYHSIYDYDRNYGNNQTNRNTRCVKQPLVSSDCCNAEGEDRYGEWMTVLRINPENEHLNMSSAAGLSIVLYIFVILKEEFAKLLIQRFQASAYSLNTGNGVLENKIKLGCVFTLKIIVLLIMMFIISLKGQVDNEALRDHIWVLDAFSVILSILLLIQLFNCLALIPKMGVPIFMFLQSLQTLLPFLVIYFMALTIYGILFLQRMPCLDFEAFAGKNWVLSAIYTVFRMTLNLLDFPKEHTSNLWLLQVFVVVLIPIFILNFIIAVVNSRVQFVSDHIETLFLLNQLRTVLEFDSYFRLPILNMKWYYKGFCKDQYKAIFVNQKIKDVEVKS